MSRAVLAAAFVLGLAGCRAPVTEALVTVSAQGLHIGTDINRLHLSAEDRVASFTGFDQTLQLCESPAPGCYTLPLSVVLYPGAHGVDDPVRLLVEGLKDNRIIISDAAILTFTVGVRKQLDVVLSSACLNVTCSGSDQVCVDGVCKTVMAMDPPDLLVVPVDLSAADFSSGSDLPTPDLAPAPCGHASEACCTNGGPECFDSLNACVRNFCVPCGALSSFCCPAYPSCQKGFGCDDNFLCTALCGGDGEPCCSISTPCAAGLSCALGRCLPAGCGGSGESCCAGSQCGDGLSCVNNMCVLEPCNIPGVQCCPTSIEHCATDYYCDQSGLTCVPCGYYGLPACPGQPACTPGVLGDPAAGICTCGFAGAYCCGGAGGICFESATCNPTSGVCQ